MRLVPNRVAETAANDVEVGVKLDGVVLTGADGGVIATRRDRVLIPAADRCGLSAVGILNTAPGGRAVTAAGILITAPHRRKYIRTEIEPAAADRGIIADAASGPSAGHGRPLARG